MRLRARCPARSSVATAARAILLAVACSLNLAGPAAPKESEERAPAVQLVLAVGGPAAGRVPIPVVRSATVNFADLARREALGLGSRPPVRPLLRPEMEEPAEPAGAIAPEGFVPAVPFGALVASPSPSSSFMGLNDIPMVDSSYIVIPPDVGGAVGLTRTLEGHNNNYRILNKTDGSVVSTVGTATFWAAATGGAHLLELTDPRTLYDPYNNRWIVEMQTVTGGAGLILLGVSQTSDPAGNWFLYSFSTGATIDFPNLGFNKNWIAVAINRYSMGGTFQRGITLVVDYPQARAGTLASGTIFTQAANTHFCSSPCATYSATEDTLFVVTHLSSSGGTYSVDVITGTPGSPVYTAGGALTRPGGGWVQPVGQIQPQSAPISGASACSPPCPIETQDSQVRSVPVYRNGFIYYAQTIGLPSSGLTHTGLQWTKITPSTTAAFADGGRIEDATATSTNGGKWYAFPHIAVNSVGDFLVGYTQFSSAQHPSAGYSYHDHLDGAGTIRDPLIYKAGEDYYHKDFGGGRNRWGDFSQVSVDPSDDRSLWALQEYAKARVNTDDGTTGANGSRWSTYWGNVAGPPPTVTLAAGPSHNEGNSSTTPFDFTVNLSTGYSVPVTVNYQTADGTATLANNDYQAASGSIVIPAGETSGTITVNAVGDTQGEPDETFTVTLTGATNGTIGSPGVSTGTILNDDLQSFTITASAGAHGAISPSGAVGVTQGASQAFTITPDICYHVSDVLVDGSSAGAVTAYTFTNVQANHTISASFAINGPFTITASAGAGGTITPAGIASVACADSQSYAIAPSDSCHVIADVKVDGVSVGAVPSYKFTNVQADHTIAATFAPTSLVLSTTDVDASCTGVSDGSIDLTVTGGAPGYTYAWSNGATTQDLSALAAGIYTVTVTDSRSCQAVLADTIGVHAYTITATAGANGSIAPSGSVDVACGTNATFMNSPDSAFVVDQLVVDGGNVSPAPSYTFTNVTANHTISVTFKPVVLAVGPLPTEFALSRVTPNPVRGRLQLQYAIPTESSVRLSILDLQGREVAVLAEGLLPAGRYSAGWDAPGPRGPAAGIYFVRFTASHRTLIRKFVLTR